MQYYCASKSLCSPSWERHCKPCKLERLFCASSSCGFNLLWHQWLSEAECDITLAANTPTLNPSPHSPPSCSMPGSGDGGSRPLEKDLPHMYRLCSFPAVSTALQALCPPSLSSQEVWAPCFKLLSPSPQALPWPCHSSYPSPSLSFAPDLRQQQPSCFTKIRGIDTHPLEESQKRWSWQKPSMPPMFNSPCAEYFSYFRLIPGVARPHH